MPSSDALTNLTREELLVLVVQLIAEVQRLQAEVDRLTKPPTTSHNSSQPPSRDQKRNVPANSSPRPRGAKPGHVKAVRSLVDHPDSLVESPVTICKRCGTDLHTVAPQRILRRQLTELPEIKPVVIETRQHEVVCPGCGQLQHGTLPEGLEATRQFGPRLEALVTYFHHEHHLGFERLQTVLADVLNIPLSEGGAVAILERAGATAQPAAEVIGERVRQSAVIGSDETSARVNGRNWWEWVFVSAVGEYHVIKPSRGQDVIDEFMGDHCADVWNSDCWKPQLKVPAKQHQLCIPHQIRNLQGLIDQRPRLIWAHELQDLFRAAIHLHHRRNVLTALGFRRQVTVIEERLDRLLQRRVTGRGALNQRERYRTHRNSLLVFLYRTDVSPDNNACERALRPSVIHRKVMGSFRLVLFHKSQTHGRRAS
ncbi:MAG: IS66 family transposase [Chloroflexi bacterium]|nr:IS66 family transposase [Chloroflexota bacterium]